MILYEEIYVFFDLGIAFVLSAIATVCAAAAAERQSLFRAAGAALASGHYLTWQAYAATALGLFLLVGARTAGIAGAARYR